MRPVLSAAQHASPAHASVFIYNISMHLWAELLPLTGQTSCNTLRMVFFLHRPNLRAQHVTPHNEKSEQHLVSCETSKVIKRLPKEPHRGSIAEHIPAHETNDWWRMPSAGCGTLCLQNCQSHAASSCPCRWDDDACCSAFSTSRPWH